MFKKYNHMTGLTLNNFIPPILLGEENNTESFTILDKEKFNDDLFLFEFTQELEKFINKYPHLDFIYQIPENDIAGKDVPEVYVAGSNALQFFIHRILGKSVEWNAGDLDIFFLNTDVDDRIRKCPADFIYVKEKTIDELLLNFDISCCRVAYDFNHNYYISAQALYSLLSETKTVYLPTFMECEDVFKQYLDNRHMLKAEGLMEVYHTHFLERCNKYQERGFEFEYIEFEDNYDISWLNKTIEMYV